MTQNERDLLLEDFCARLLYGVKVKFMVNKVSANEEKFIYNIEGEFIYITNGKSYLTLDIIKALFNNHFDEIKPYLFLLSSMTNEQNKVYLNTCKYGNTSFPTLETFEWCLKNHFDYRGLIPMSLAIDATNLNIY